MTELLTRRQLEVVQVYVRTGDAKSAALALGIAPATVRTTMERARVREGFATTSQLVAQLARRGLL